MPCEEIRRAVQEVLLALHQKCGIKDYEIRQVLESLAEFWVGLENRSRTLDDYDAFFGGRGWKRR